jgi:hypothetical protein
MSLTRRTLQEDRTASCREMRPSATSPMIFANASFCAPYCEHPPQADASELQVSFHRGFVEVPAAFDERPSAVCHGETDVPVGDCSIVNDQGRKRRPTMRRYDLLEAPEALNCGLCFRTCRIEAGVIQHRAVAAQVEPKRERHDRGSSAGLGSCCHLPLPTANGY